MLGQFFIDDLNWLLRRLLLTGSFLIVFAFICAGQEPPKATLVDEFSNLFCSDDLRGRIDGFFADLSEKPESTGYTVASADRAMVGRFYKYFRIFHNHARFRNFDPDRIKFSRGPDSDSLHIRFWLVPKGAQPPSVTVEYRRKPIDSAVLFDASEISSVNNGIVEFGGDLGGEPCDFGLDLNQFAIHLGANPNVKAYLVASASGRRNTSKTKLALRLTARELSKKHGVPARRIKTVFVGNRKNAEMQLWLVPKDNTLPTFRSRLP